MNAIILVCLFGLAAVAARPNDTYPDKWDNIDLEEILANDRLLNPYIKCLMDQGRCAPDAKELKEHISDALQNECSKCTEAQQKGVRRVIAHLVNKKPQEWAELSAKYDPDNKYSKKYEKELKELKE